MLLREEAAVDGEDVPGDHRTGSMSIAAWTGSAERIIGGAHLRMPETRPGSIDSRLAAKALSTARSASPKSVNTPARTATARSAPPGRNGNGIRCSRGSPVQPLTPPTASPPTIYRWKKKNTIETGAAKRIENAAKSDQAVCPNAPTILLSASESV